MREIKFRAWDREQKKIFHVDSLVFEKGNAIVNGKTDIDLMQYTGLKDKNGVEIFESDIIKLLRPSSKSGVLVEFKNEYVGGWVLTNPATDNHISLGARCEEELLVIGNLHQNPELLKCVTTKSTTL